jgi:hypothetical protein
MILLLGFLISGYQKMGINLPIIIKRRKSRAQLKGAPITFISK